MNKTLFKLCIDITSDDKLYSLNQSISLIYFSHATRYTVGDVGFFKSFYMCMCVYYLKFQENIK